jgi:hypothetical protein
VCLCVCFCMWTLRMRVCECTCMRLAMCMQTCVSMCRVHVWCQVMLAVENSVSRLLEWHVVTAAPTPGRRERPGGEGRRRTARRARDAFDESRLILCALVSDKSTSHWWQDEAFVALSERGHAGDDGVFEVHLPAAADCRLCGALVWQRSELHHRLIRGGRPEPLVAFWLHASH